MQVKQMLAAKDPSFRKDLYSEIKVNYQQKLNQALNQIINKLIYNQEQRECSDFTGRKIKMVEKTSDFVTYDLHHTTLSGFEKVNLAQFQVVNFLCPDVLTYNKKQPLKYITASLVRNQNRDHNNLLVIAAKQALITLRSDQLYQLGSYLVDQILSELGINGKNTR